MIEPLADVAPLSETDLAAMLPGNQVGIVVAA